MNYDAIRNLPITSHLDQICSTLKQSPSRFLVLTAQTAAGKSTAVPLALLNNFDGKILMLEPRRLAAVAIASRVAQLLGEDTGKTAGYTLHLESRTSRETRFEVITEAVLTRRLQSDPSLEGVNVVVLDEFHERSVHADLALAFLKEAMSLRDDLFVIVMSATMDSKRVSAYLDNAPVLNIEGRQFDVKIDYNDSLSPSKAIYSIINSTNNRLLANNHSLVSDQRTDSILCFLPGIYEITKTKSELQNLLAEDEAEILILHSSVSLSEQKKVLSPVPSDQPRRIILSSAIAETSLTVPGVSAVVDSGLCRINKIDLSLGMERLVTEKVSQFSADQRAGRAGRLMNGYCLRLWNKFDLLNKELEPEIKRCDLSSLVLECLNWGAADASSLQWLDSPSKAAWQTSLQLLQQLGFVKDSKITEEGRAALKLGISPRLACAAIYGKKTGNISSALDFILKFSEYSSAKPQIQEKFISNLSARLNKLQISASGESFKRTNLLLCGFPDRLARKISQNNQTVYQLVSGRQAVLNNTNATAPDWIVAIEIDAGSTTGKIYSYEEVSQAQIEPWLNQHSQTQIKAWFDKETHKLKKSQITLCGQLVLNEKILVPSAEDYGQALCNEIEENGFSCLPCDDSVLNLLIRTCFFIQQTKSSDEQSGKNLLEKIESLVFNSREWLLPFVNGTSINSQIIYNALFWYLDGSVIDEKVPVQFVLKTGKKLKIQYKNRLSGDKLTIDSLLTNVRSLNIEPVAEVIIQQIFGNFTNPQILGCPVVLSLLSPARRPLQITSDLENFWSGAWIEICKEMKGRYPKHNWDYRIAEKD